MRIFTNTLVRINEEEIVCHGQFNRRASFVAILLGCVVLGVGPFLDLDMSEMHDFVLFAYGPALGLTLLGLLGHFYDRWAYVDVQKRQVAIKEKWLGLPFSTHRYTLDEFERVAPGAQDVGSESSHETFFTVMLDRPYRPVLLFDMEHYDECEQMCERLNSLLGFE